MSILSSLSSALVSWLFPAAGRPADFGEVVHWAEPAAPDPEQTDVASRPVLTVLIWLAPRVGGHRLVFAWSRDDEPPVLSDEPVAGLDQRTRNARVLDRFAEAYSLAQQHDCDLDLWLGCRPVRDELAQVVGAFPGLSLRDRPGERHVGLREYAVARLECPVGVSPPARTQPETFTPPTLVVATDASIARGVCGIGIACITEAGEVATEFIDSGECITVGEILAVDLALRTFPNQPLTVLTDSRAVEHAVAHPHRQSPAARRALTRIARAERADLLTIHWVRGHRGHPLNEAADRHARATRAAAQLRQPAPTPQAITADIAVGVAAGRVDGQSAVA